MTAFNSVDRTPGRPRLTDSEAASLSEDCLKHLVNLVRIPTVNPPGNEKEAALYIAGVLEAEGIPFTLVETAPGRANLVARLSGTGDKRPLLLLGHLDVVPADGKDWSCDPFAACIRDGFVYGRGTLDCKGTVALWLSLLVFLKRRGIPLSRDLILCATADEEASQELGIGFLVKHHWDLIEAEAALNEGGGFPISFGGRLFYTCQTAEKGNLWLTLTCRGRGGHGSTPAGVNAVADLAHALTRLSLYRFPFVLRPTVKTMIGAMSSGLSFPLSAGIGLLKNSLLSTPILNAAVSDETVRGGLKAMFRNTISPTVLRAGSATNVIPSEASAELDMRILPGEDRDAVLDRVRKAAGGLGELEVIDFHPPSESPADHPLFDAIRESLLIHAPGCPLVPFMQPSVTDGCYLRPRGVVVYGFSPLLPLDDIGLSHGADERISFASLSFALESCFSVIISFAG